MATFSLDLYRNIALIWVMKECGECGGEVSFDTELEKLVCSTCGEFFEEKFEMDRPDRTVL